jgi:hypothetical protein
MSNPDIEKQFARSSQLPRERGYERGRVVRRQGDTADLLKGGSVTFDLLRIIQVKVTGGVLKVHDIRIGWREEAVDREGTTDGRMLADVQGQDVKRQGRDAHDFGQVEELPALHILPAYRAPKSALFQNECKGRTAIRPQQTLPRHAELDPSFGLLRWKVGPQGADHRPGVFLGLKQPVNNHWLVGMDLVGRDLQADKGNNERVAIGLPPAPLPGFPGDVDQAVTTHGIDAVELEHLSNIPRGGADLPILDAGDL